MRRRTGKKPKGTSLSLQTFNIDNLKAMNWH